MFEKIRPIYVSENMQYRNYSIVLIKDFPCNSKQELCMKECERLGIMAINVLYKKL